MKHSREIKVGILAILCAVILYFGLNFLKGINIFSSTASYVGKYENINGLTEQAPVYIKGYQVGLVERIQYDFTKNPAFVVSVSIDKNIQLPVGTEMALRADGLLGGMAIEMVLPTTAITGLCQKGDTLKSVVVPGLFESLEHGVLAKLDSVLDETTTLMATLNNELSEGSLHQTLQNVEQISYDLRVSGNDLRKLTHNQLPGIIAKVDSTVTSISTLANEVEQVDIAGLVDSINTVVGGVNQAIQSHEGTLGLLLNDKALYDNLNTTLINLDNVVLGVDSIVTSIKARAFIQKKLPK
jgi:phospholipid/cholesterol/gamma-HCH transport system substrate-binding protein